MATLCRNGKCLQKSNKAHFYINILKNIEDPPLQRKFEWKYVQLKFLWWVDTTKSYPEKREWHLCVPISFPSIPKWIHWPNFGRHFFNKRQVNKVNIESLNGTWHQGNKFFFFIKWQNGIDQNFQKCTCKPQLTYYLYSFAWMMPLLLRDSLLI